MTNNTDEINSLRQQLADRESDLKFEYTERVNAEKQLAESQARVKELEDLLLEARDDVYDCLQHDLPNAGYERYDKRIEFRQKHIASIDAAIANKSPSSALDRAIRQAKVEALEDAAHVCEDVRKSVEIDSALCAADLIYRMADELRNAP